MANKLVLEFYDANGAVVKQTYNYASGSATTANVKSLMSGLITNGDIFATVPIDQKSAKLVQTTETEYDLSA